MNRGKIFASLLIIVVALALSFGATMAFFTDDIQAPTNTFQAGTVEIENGQEVVTGGDMGNVNPGDCFEKCFTIINRGSKAIELRMTGFTGVWSFDGVASGLPLLYEDGPLYIAPVGDDWKMRKVGDSFEFYYTGGPIASGEEVQLCIIVAFDGPKMDDRYQDITLELNGTFAAVQASNDAPISVWSDANWEAWKADGGWFSMNHYDALVYSMGAPYANYYETTKCFNGNGGNGETIIKYPKNGNAYIGYEDRPSGSDFDYNDFGMNMELEETYVDDVLTAIEMKFTAVVNRAGDDHDIHIIRPINGDYTYTITRNDGAHGNETPAVTDEPGSGSFDIILFDTDRWANNASQVMGQEVVVEITIAEGNDQNLITDFVSAPRFDLDDFFSLYNPMMYNRNIPESHGIGKWQSATSPLPSNGYDVPYIITVPFHNWTAPDEGVPVTDDYPDFANYYNTEDSTYEEWYIPTP